MKTYKVFVPIEGFEVYKVNAETSQEATEQVLSGAVSMFDSEVEWRGDTPEVEEI